jgi:predicted RNA polymerase sigma factor
MLLHDARRDARIRDDEIVLLDDQDRALWDHQQIIPERPTHPTLLRLSALSRLEEPDHVRA